MCIEIEFLICTLICNIDRPVNSLKVHFQRQNLVKSLRILREFDKKSQIYEISKYCKHIAMQKSTLEKMLIIPTRHVSVCRKEKYLIVFYEKVSKWVKIAQQNLCKNSLVSPSNPQKKKSSEKNV